MLLDVLEDNHNARRFYEACGFVYDRMCDDWRGLVRLRYV
ncbi:MAG: hypothetical protein FWB76_00590 [Oscillospiraceae bacterium]|nr:hypothetical protein [Oscillospiraceae bacterium]